MALLEFIFVGMAAGWVIGMIRRGKGYGLLGNLFVGALGSMIGWFLTGFLRVPVPHVFLEITMAVAGAIVFFFLVGFLWGKGKRRRKRAE